MSAFPSEYTYNYAAGPAVLPQAVHERFTADLNAPRKIPLLELGHRTPEFDYIVENSEYRLRELLNIPQDYAVLFLTGGARSQYAAVSMNLNAMQHSADYFNTGYWSVCAIEEAKRYAPVSLVTNLTQSTPYRLPLPSDWKIDSDSAYCHYVANETLIGLEFSPDAVPQNLVADMTSNLLTQAIDVNRHCLIYAATQKNLGIAGLTIVIVARDRLQKASQQTPSVYNYTKQEQASSRFSTPAILAWYVCHLVLEWVKEEGGVEEMHRRCVQRSSKIYACICLLYTSPSPRDRTRSRMPSSA